MNRGLVAFPAGGLRVGDLADPGLSSPAAGHVPAYDVTTRRFTSSRVKYVPGWNLYNFDPTKLTRWRVALANARIGTANAKMMFIGDSITLGFPSTGVTDANKSWPKYFCDAHTVINGITTSHSSAFGSGDTRVTQGTGWSNPGGMPQAGLGIAQTSASGNLSFTPAASFDTLKIWYAQGSGQGTFTVNVDGGSSLGSTSTAGATAVNSVTFTVAAGTHTINIPPPTVNQVQVCAIEVWTAATLTSTIRTYNISTGSTTTANYLPGTGSAWTMGRWVALVQPHLAFLALGANDTNNALAARQSYNNYVTIINDIRTNGGDVVLTTNPPFAAALSNDLEWRDMVFQLSEDMSIPVFDLNARLGASKTAETAMWGVSGHLDANGYADVGWAIAKALASVA